MREPARTRCNYDEGARRRVLKPTEVHPAALSHRVFVPRAAGSLLPEPIGNAFVPTIVVSPSGRDSRGSLMGETLPPPASPEASAVLSP